MQELRSALKSAVKELFNEDIEPELSRPEEQFGDCSTNIAMQLAAKAGKPPREIAEALAAKLQDSGMVAKAEIAGPGFINIYLTSQAILDGIERQPAKNLDNKEILVEFGDPNPFKEMHIGHLYSYIAGDAISRLFESQGAKVQRLSYHGDIGLHVAKTLWGMQKSGVDRNSSAEDLGKYYAQGAQAYEQDETAKQEIENINQLIYSRDDDETNKLYQWGREASFNYFDKVLGDLEVKINKRYLESQAADTGIEYVRQNTGKVFEESEGAVVYKGEKAGLHTRVFLTSKGLPTYEAKDLGLAELKNKDYPQAARSIIITAHEQAEYFKVMLAALKEIDPEIADKTEHRYHGFVSLSSGKMSSRTGEVFSAAELLADVKAEAKKRFPDSGSDIHIGAIKYAFLKQRIGADVVYDPAESVSLQGNSGPYLQYAYVRARSILDKAGRSQPEASGELEADERSLARKIGEYPEVVEAAANELLPSHICTYLYELAQTFNRFYENNRVVGDARQAIRLKLVSSYANVLKNGLELLNIPAVERM